MIGSVHEPMTGMRLRVLPDADAVARAGADIVAGRLRGPVTGALGVATGSSPEGIYRLLADAVRRGELDASDWSAFALDEYVGLAPGASQSYIEVLRRQVQEPLGLAATALQAPDAAALRSVDDAPLVCAAYESAIRAAGGIALQLLGIGSNGHIGFNEPGSAFDSRTRLERLDPSTRAANARFFDSLDDVPESCLTQGIGTILEARSILLVATGAHKAAAIAALIDGPATRDVPASALQAHPDVTVLVDRAAASELVRSTIA